MSVDNNPSPASAPSKRDGDAPTLKSFSLRGAIRCARRNILDALPFPPEAAPARAAAAAGNVDKVVTNAIHNSYQTVKAVTDRSPPAFVLGVTGLAVSLPCARLGFRPFVVMRNTAVALAITSFFIYPDKIASRVEALKSLPEKSTKSA
jgi:hypothetical protein